MTRAEASRRRIQEAGKRPAFRSVVLFGPTTRPLPPFAAARCRWRRAVESRRARVSIRTVAVRVGGDRAPAMLRSDHDDRGPADRVEDRRVGTLARQPAMAGQLGGAADPGGRPRRQRRGDGHGTEHHAVLDRLAARRAVAGGRRARGPAAAPGARWFTGRPRRSERAWCEPGAAGRDRLRRPAWPDPLLDNPHGGRLEPDHRRHHGIDADSPP
jgi:hypothetical protein